jgi:FKBP-type peptidyl-prolyl cis-trans isomerase
MADPYLFPVRKTIQSAEECALTSARILPCLWAMRPIRPLILSLVFLLPMAVRAQREKLPPDDLDFVERTWPNAKKTFTGMRYVVEKPGHGPVVNPGDKVSVLYVGRLLNGKVFDKSLDPSRPFTFRTDRFAVIPGWDEALERMNLGEKLLIILPGDLGYGVRGSPPIIGPDQTLVFEIELLKIERGD